MGDINRYQLFDELIPQTQTFLLMIYDDIETYASISDQTTNPYSLLEDACMLYDASYYYSESAIRGLELLGVPHSETYEPIALYNKLNEILSNPEIKSKYLRNL
jgi:hypothetical protein